MTLFGDQSLLQQTVERVLPVAPIENILIITNRAQAAGVRKQLPCLPRQNVIAEPCGRDTCAAIVLGAAIVEQRNPCGVMAVLPADHLIQDQKKFQRVLIDCFQLADKEEQLVTIGIQPTQPATSYGYIKEGGKLEAAQRAITGKTKFNKVDRFVEKPQCGESAAVSQIWSIPLECGDVRLVCSNTDACLSKRTCPRWSKRLKVGNRLLGVQRNWQLDSRKDYASCPHGFPSTMP